MVVDVIGAQVSAKAFACLLLIIRKTRGWNKQSDAIAMSQFGQFLKVKDWRTIEKAINELETIGAVKVVRKRGKWSVYSLGPLFESYPQVPAKNAGALNAGTSKKCKKVPAKNVGLQNTNIQNRADNKSYPQGDPFNIPANDHDLVNWAEAHGYPGPVSGHTFEQYRKRLTRAVRDNMARRH